MYSLVEKRRYYFIFSGILISLGILAMVFSVVRTGSPFLLGVDFRSGTRFEIQFNEPVTEDVIAQVFSQAGYPGVSIIGLQGEGLQNAWQARTTFMTAEEAQEVERQLNAVSPLLPGTTQVQSVSPSVGEEVTRAAIIAVIVAATMVLFYIMFVFRQVPHPFRYGACAVIAMLHDLMIIFGFAAIAGMVLGWEVDALFLTAVLTIAGFSLQDTIIIFDRVRENIPKRPMERFEKLVNRSVLEVIHRSLATQMNAMFILVALLIFGGASIKPFVAVLFVGMLSGQYSSIFTAAPLLVAWENEELPLVR
ncbi:MAG: protein translocase subunit SecF [Chloroflexota bacterium]|jgi:preprotein translocase SecF subunit